MTTSGGGSTIALRRAPASAGRPNGSSQAVRMNLFVLVRILFQYLERVDTSVLDLAKAVLKDCERKHNTKDSKYETLADAISERVRDAVGETHWTQARKIQKQLAANQQKKRLKAMAQAAQRSRGKGAGRSSSQQTGIPSMGQQQSTPSLGGQMSRRLSGNDEAMEAAQAMSALAQQSTSATPTNTTSSSAEMEVDSSLHGSSNNNISLRNQEVNKSSLSIDNNSVASSSLNRGGPGGTTTSGQLPLRKRIMFASPPTTSTTPPPSSASSSFSSRHR